MMGFDFQISIPVGETFMVGMDKFRVDEYEVKDWDKFDRGDNCSRCYFSKIAGESGLRSIKHSPYIEAHLRPCGCLACHFDDRIDRKVVFFTKIGGRFD